jgi:O-antigen ligase
MISGKKTQEALPLLLLLFGFVLLESRDYSQAQENPVSLENIHKVIAIISVIIIASWRLLTIRQIFFKPFFIQIQLYFLGVAVVSTIAAWSGSLIPIWKIAELSAVALASMLMVRSTILEVVPNTFYLSIVLNFFRFLLIMTALSVVFLPTQSLVPPVSEETLQTIEPLLVPFQVSSQIIKINPNTIGAISGILLIFHLFLPKNMRKWQYNVFWIFLSASFLILSQSRTALAATILACFTVVMFNRKSTAAHRMGLVLIGFISLTVFAEDIWRLASRGMEFERLSQLSGRVSWWTAAISEYTSSDIISKAFGIGYYTGGREILSGIGHEEASSLHSDYVDTLISTGAIGLLLLLLFVICSFILILKNCTKSIGEMGGMLLGLFIIVAIRSLTGQTLMTYNPFYIFAITILISAYANKRKKRDQIAVVE